jgi:hypothetical protein
MSMKGSNVPHLTASARAVDHQHAIAELLCRAPKQTRSGQSTGPSTGTTHSKIQPRRRLPRRSLQGVGALPPHPPPPLFSNTTHVPLLTCGTVIAARLLRALRIVPMLELLGIARIHRCIPPRLVPSTGCWPAHGDPFDAHCNCW